MRNNSHAILRVLALAVCGAIAAISAPPAAAQTSAPASQKIIKTRFEVVRMFPLSIQVRSLTDVREVHTFSYSPRISVKMQNLFKAGGYQYGDKIVVWHTPGANVALKIKGKPSKPS